jgi:predicted nucleotidyltransferase component of viral defense system
MNGAGVLDKAIIEKLRHNLGFKDPGIFEKAVYALNLLPSLLDVYPNLIFKGGTSILLHQYPPLRLSIDIDILLPENARASLNSKLAAVASASGIFKSFEEDVRDSRIPKAHFKFFYDSHFSKPEQNILLDMVFCESPYSKVVKKSLKGNALILKDTNAVVTIPTAEGLFGDKLTAMAPKTLGLRLTDGRDMEFVKQVIDLGGLFELVSSVDEIKKAFENTAEQENGFRRTHFTLDEVIEDILDVAWKYSQWMVKGGDNLFKEITSINRGMERVRNHLVGNVDSGALKLIFGRIAYVLKLIGEHKTEKVLKTVDLSMVKDLRLEGKFKILEGLRKAQAEAYGYWALAAGTG